MATFGKGKIEAFVGPRELGASDDLEKVIVDFIGGARESLDIAIQELDNLYIAQAILDAKWRGVRVRIFLEQDYLKNPRLPKLKLKKGEKREDAIHRLQWEAETLTNRGLSINREILRALLRNDVDVKADYNPKIFHQKFIIRDYRGRKKKQTALLTGSTNFTETGTHKNLNNLVIFHDYRICRAYLKEFQEIQSGTFGNANQRHKGVPRSYNLGGIPVRILFGPDDAPELEMMKQMLKCEKELYFAIFTFSGSSGIDDAMRILMESRRKIQGAVDPKQGAQSWSAVPWLHKYNIGIYMPEKEKGFGKLHHKLMVIDQSIVIAGSMNYTKPANLYNDENIFVMGSPYKLKPKDGGPVDHKECARLADFFKNEIKRIIKKSKRYGNGKKT